MKKILLIFSILIVSAHVSQAGIGEVSIRNTSVKKIGDTVEVTFDMDVNEFHKDYKITLVPILYNQMNRAEALPPVSIAGRRKAISDHRVGMPAGDATMLKYADKKTLRYSTSIPFKEWMQFVSVDVYQFDEGCLKLTEKPRKAIAEGRLLYYEAVPYFSMDKLQYELSEFDRIIKDTTYLHPMEDYPKRYEILKNDREKGAASVIFKVGSSVIDNSVRKNIDALDGMVKVFDIIEKEPSAQVKHIFIAGYASPEGPLSLNTRLAQNRADAVKKTLQSRIKNLDDGLFELYNGREDWEGLRREVEKTDMEKKQEVLDIIGSYTMEQEERKVKLQQLAGGKPYQYMLSNIYPSLRTAGYVQFYYEIDRRANISSATAEADSAGRIDLNSPRNKAVTAINNAIDLMIENKFAEALDVMLEYKADSRAWNNIGVCYMMTGKYDEAGGYFVKAKENGDKDALKNIEQIEWMMKVER